MKDRLIEGIEWLPQGTLFQLDGVMWRRQDHYICGDMLLAVDCGDNIRCDGSGLCITPFRRLSQVESTGRGLVRVADALSRDCGIACGEDVKAWLNPDIQTDRTMKVLGVSA